MDERFDVIILGRLIGTADGWDAVGELKLHFLNFKPAPGLEISNATETLFWDVENGWLYFLDADIDMECSNKVDASWITNLPRHLP